MNMFTKRLPLPIITSLLLTFFALPKPPVMAAAEDIFGGMAISYPIADNETVEGDLLCFSEEGKLVRCQKSYDEKIFGVHLTKPQIILRQGADEKPVVRTGRITINATTLNGEIRPGDNLTSSTFAGKAQKAVEPIGYIIGQALTGLSNQDGEKITINGKEYRIGKIEAVLNPGPQGVLPRGTVFDKLGYALVKGTQSPQAAGTFLRYIMAGILTVSVSLFALTNFGRNLNKGIEAIGRNPLAKGQVHFAIIVNTALVAGLVVGSIILGLVIIRI